MAPTGRCGWCRRTLVSPSRRSQEATGFELHIDDVVETRLPTDEELRLIREVLDPKTLRDKEVPSS